MLGIGVFPLGENGHAATEKESMKRVQLTLLVIGLLTLPLLGQTAKKIATINKRVAGKWVSNDGKSYIEFLANGSCSTGELYPDGKWHVDQGTLYASQEGETFFCGSGALTLIRPNTLTRDYGMGGKPDIFHREAASDASPPDRFVIHTSKGDVAVLDFRKHPVSITEDRQTIEIEVKNDFQIVFNVGDSSFAITILVKPLPVVRKEAEAAFLKDLGISQSDACKLSAYEGTTMRIDPRYAGQSYGFSFCAGTPQPRVSAGNSKP